MFHPSSLQKDFFRQSTFELINLSLLWLTVTPAFSSFFLACMNYLHLRPATCSMTDKHMHLFSLAFAWTFDTLLLERYQRRAAANTSTFLSRMHAYVAFLLCPTDTLPHLQATNTTFLFSFVWQYLPRWNIICICKLCLELKVASVLSYGGKWKSIRANYVPVDMKGHMPNMVSLNRTQLWITICPN